MLPAGVEGRLPWLQGTFRPSHLEILSGAVTIALRLPSGVVRDFSIRAPDVPGGGEGEASPGPGGPGGPGGLGDGDDDDDDDNGNERARAEFPVGGAITEWWLRERGGPPAFFALAWRDGADARHKQRDRLEGRLNDFP